MTDPVVIGDATLHRGDALDVLPTLDAKSVDCVAADPPYIIGAVSVGDPRAKCGSYEDVSNSSRWFGEWFAACRRVLKPTGHLLVFGNWRSLPTLLLAGSRCEMTASSCIVWDKEWIGTGGPKGFRPTWELMLHFAMSGAVVEDRRESDVWRCQWMAGNCGDCHPAEKPVVLMRRAVKHLSPPGGVVLDPFMGSGTTGLACLIEGRRFVGCEMSPGYFEIARKRLAAFRGELSDGLFAKAEEVQA